MAQESCGGIWKHKKKDGETFLSIELNGQKYVAWLNDKGGNEKRPDFRIYPSEPVGDGQQSTPRTAPPRQEAKPSAEIVKDVFTDDIPL